MKLILLLANVSKFTVIVYEIIVFQIFKNKLKHISLFHITLVLFFGAMKYF